MNHVTDEETYSAEEDDWTPDRIHPIQQKFPSLGTNGKNGPPFYTATLVVIKRPINFIINTGSPVTPFPKTKFNNTTTINPVTTDYRDVNDNRTKFEGKTTAMSNGTVQNNNWSIDNNQKTHTNYLDLIG